MIASTASGRVRGVSASACTTARVTRLRRNRRPRATRSGMTPPRNSCARPCHESGRVASGSATVVTATTFGVSCSWSTSGTMSVASCRSSVTTASGGNGLPNTVAANAHSSSARVAPPRVAEVATGVIRPSGRPGSATRSVAPSRRSSMATSVPCAPS